MSFFLELLCESNFCMFFESDFVQTLVRFFNDVCPQVASQNIRVLEEKT